MLPEFPFGAPHSGVAVSPRKPCREPRFLEISCSGARISLRCSVQWCPDFSEVLRTVVAGFL